MSAKPRTIRKYPNRRLYDVANDGYITIADVKALVLKNIAFQVVDATSGKDLTRAVLLQIILEEESSATPLFSSEMLAQIVRFHGAAQQSMAGAYIEENVNAFLEVQRKLQQQVTAVCGDEPTQTTALWQQFLQLQAPAMQGMLGDLLARSAEGFLKKP